jgi:hypothetical protein
MFVVVVVVVVGGGGSGNGGVVINSVRKLLDIPSYIITYFGNLT